MSVQVLPLSSTHDQSKFDCGVEILNQWLRTQAKQQERKSYSRTFVAVDTSTGEVVGFYALNSSQAFGKRFRRQYPEKIPTVTLGRLAVDVRYQGDGLGAFLLLDALHRVHEVAPSIGITAVLVKAKSDHGAGFYKRYGFTPSVDDPLDLIMPVATIAELFGLKGL